MVFHTVVLSILLYACETWAFYWSVSSKQSSEESFVSVWKTASPTTSSSLGRLSTTSVPLGGPRVQNAAQSTLLFEELPSGKRATTRYQNDASSIRQRPKIWKTVAANRAPPSLHERRCHCRSNLDGFKQRKALYIDLSSVNSY